MIWVVFPTEHTYMSKRKLTCTSWFLILVLIGSLTSVYIISLHFAASACRSTLERGKYEEINRKPLANHQREIEKGSGWNLETLPEKWSEISRDQNFDELDEQILEVEMANVPVSFWRSIKPNLSEYNIYPGCGQMPHILELNENNLVWQTLSTGNGMFHLYSAHYDIRPLVSEPTIRIFGMINRLLHPKVGTMCQVWFANDTMPLAVPVVKYRFLRDVDSGTIGNMFSYSIECTVPQSKE
ncbi:unnamed protein product, partial [Notodromas monacha]